MSSCRFCIVILIALAAACSEDVETPVAAVPERTVLPGVYTGIFPCDACEGIASTLWLRADERFFFRQQYPADDVHAAKTAYSFGRWESLADVVAIELYGEGPRRTFESIDSETLQMRTFSEQEHLLTLQSAATEFTDVVRMSGVMQMQGKGASFTECLTGYVVPVSSGVEFAKFRHQYRSAVGKGKPAFAEFEGRFAWSADHAPQSLSIERFITIKANGSC